MPGQTRGAPGPDSPPEAPQDAVPGQPEQDVPERQSPQDAVPGQTQETPGLDPSRVPQQGFGPGPGWAGPQPGPPQGPPEPGPSQPGPLQPGPSQPPQGPYPGPAWGAPPWSTAPTAPPRPSPRWRRRPVLLAGGIGIIVAALVAGLSTWLLTGRPAHHRPALDTAPFRAAVSALATAPELHYRRTVAGVGPVDVHVTSHDEVVGTATSDGEQYQLLQVDGTLYVKPPADGLPGVDNKSETAALHGKWLSGTVVDDLLRPVSSQIMTPLQLGSRLLAALSNRTTTYPLAGATGTLLDGVRVLRATTPAGVLYVTARAPYRIVRLAPAPKRRAKPSPTRTKGPLFSLGTVPAVDARDAAYSVHSIDGAAPASAAPSAPGDPGAVPDASGTDFMPEQPGDIDDTYQQMESDTKELSDAVDSDLHFALKGDGSISCGGGGCHVTATVTNSISAGSADATITGGSVRAQLTANVTIEGKAAGSCAESGELPLNGTGSISCTDTAAGGVFTSVEAEKKAQAEAESEAEDGAEVPYYVHEGGDFYVYATAQVDVEQQITTESQEKTADDDPATCDDDLAATVRGHRDGQTVVAGDPVTPPDPTRFATDPRIDLATARTETSRTGEELCPTSDLKGDEPGIADRLRAAKEYTGGRLRGFVRTNNPDFVDQYDRTYDAVGGPSAFQRGNMGQLIDQIRRHLYLKSGIDFTVLDLTGASESQVDQILRNLDTWQADSGMKALSKLIILGDSY